MSEIKQNITESGTDARLTIQQLDRSGRIVPAGNHATGTLKLIALAFMLIDHLGAVVFPGVPEMRMLGRIAFPIYCWCMVVGFYYTRSEGKYMLRILLTGLISQPLYAYVMNHMGQTESLLLNMTVYSKPNIFLTLLLGLIALWGIRRKLCFSQIWAPLAAIALATILKADYGWQGVLFIIMLYGASSTRSGIASVMVAYFLFWGTGYSITNSLFGHPLNLALLRQNFNFLYQPLSAFLRLETYGLFSLIFILIPFRHNVKLPWWASYGIYPAHLLIVQLFKLIFRS